VTVKIPLLLTVIPFLGLLTGCATWEQHGVMADVNSRYRVAVEPVEISADIRRASEIMTVTPDVENEPTLVRQQLQNDASRLSHYLKIRLGGSAHFQVVPFDKAGLSANSFASMPETWDKDKLHDLKALHNVQAVLIVKVSGYGKIKKKWLTYLIGSGLVEGVVQGVLAAKLVKNTWVGLAVALEEIGQEILVWGGGSYLFDEHYAPVTLEARLISTTDGESIWSDTVFVSIDKDALKKLPEPERKKKQVQLYVTAKKAVNVLVNDLNEKANANLKTDTASLDEFDF